MEFVIDEVRVSDAAAAAAAAADDDDDVIVVDLLRSPVIYFDLLTFCAVVSSHMAAI